MSRTERLAEPEQFGKYQLVARLAHGRMGDVYKAKVHGVEGFERILVVKTIHTGFAAVPGFLDIVVEKHSAPSSSHTPTSRKSSTSGRKSSNNAPSSPPNTSTASTSSAP